MRAIPSEATLGPEVAQWFALNLRFPEGEKKGQPFVCEPWQRDILNLVYELDEDGNRRWRFIVIGIPRGNGKSPLCAGMADFELVDRTDSPNIFCAAASRDQAGIVHGFAYSLPQGGPLDDYLLLPRIKEALGPIKCPSNDGLMRVLSADGSLQHGKNPSVVIEDETHAFVTKKQEALHFALTTALHKRPDSVMILITTAGDNKATLLGELYSAMLKTHELEYSEDRCLMVGRNAEAKSLIVWYGAPDDADVHDPKVWRACNPASWITDEALEMAARREPESIFRQYYLNQWVRGMDAAIQPGDWAACALDAYCSRRGCSACDGENFIEPGSDVWLGVDLGEQRDSSGVAICAPLDEQMVRVGATVIRPEAKEAAGTRTLIPLVEAEIRRLAELYQVRAIAFDPWQFRDAADRLAGEGLRMLEVPQNDPAMVPASLLLHDMIVERRLIHDGDPTLTRHVLSCAVKRTNRGGWRISKPLAGHGRTIDQSQKVDAGIALAMALLSWSNDAQTGDDVWAMTW